MDNLEKKKLFIEQTEQIPNTIILSSNFYLKADLTQVVTLVFTPKFLFYHFPQNREIRKRMVITFETIFQMIRVKIKSEQKKVAPPTGLRFICNGFETQQFHSDNAKMLEKWEDELLTIMNQYNFHDLIKAEKKIAQGNFATVYLGTLLRNQRKIAIKAFGKQATYSQENGKEAILNEIVITKIFNHPNLMKIQGVYQSQNSVYFALEYIEGTPICRRFNSLSRYTEAERKFIMKGIIRGLVEMARHRVVHRDLKPDNIVLSKEPVIIDFGLATVAEDPNYLFVRCGTPGYVAPQIINLKDLTTKANPISDVFSVGCIFYYLIFGRHLFMGSTPSDIISLNRECDLVLTGSQFDRLNQVQVDLLRKMLQKQPTLRICAAEALKHPYFFETDEKIYCPKILMKQSGSCPVELISKENEAAVKFIATSIRQDKKKESIVKSYDRQTIKRKIEQIDVNKLLLNS